MSADGHMWRKRILIPFWVVQIILCILAVGVGSLALVLNQKIKEDDVDVDSRVSLALNASGGVWIAFGAVCIILDIAEMILLGIHKLTPLIAFITALIKEKLWLLLLIISIRNAAYESNGAGLIFMIIIFASFLIPLIYASVVWRRSRKGYYNRGAYTTAVPTEQPNVIPFEPSDPQLHSDLEMNQYRSTAPIASVPPPTATRSPAYEPMRHGAVSPAPTGSTEYTTVNDHKAAGVSEYYSVETAYRPRSYSPYRAPEPVELVGTAASPSVYSQPGRL